MSNSKLDSKTDQYIEEPKVDIKQRMIGAIVLVSLGIIFIPLILNGGSHQNPFTSGTNIPDIPDNLKRDLPKIPPSDTMPDSKKIIAYPVTGDNNDLDYINDNKNNPFIEHTNSYKKVNSPTSDDIDSVYAIQVGSFIEKRNALDLRNKLKQKGFKAYVELVTTKRGHFYRLRVGPYLQFSQLLTIQAQLKLQFKLDKTEIVKYKTT
ncbi:MAG: SPOR domain-containing protein [Gammaproteobacteria bacterium]|nr:SPOR domain-containing protein [Gammaproteobacteria bacterium]